ncbi:stem-specific protein TSJT1-like isoform X2 [Andrographis paniculata]|uniref:stem-specific protein TSJT1-like isoform X2 n=1 Tax=Andrographis paniculata TaxID=175694 RepID=UPI0021E911CA|nr:stem-specific protein TSJT1-like isoform X2 [Andrographis paniculata]
MLAVFEKSIGRLPKELSLPYATPNCSTPEEIAAFYRSWKSDSTFYNLSNGCCFLALSHEGENPAYPRSIVVMDDIFCLFSGALDNTCDLRRHYGLSRQSSEAMIIVEAYKVLHDRAPYPPDQVIKELKGKFAFILFDSKAATVFLARDREGSVQLHWGTAGDGSLVCTDDPNVISATCGKCYTPFPPGCMFMSESGVMSFDHPLNKVRGIRREDDEGKVCAIVFQVDLFTRLQSIPRSGSASNWANPTVVEGGD